VYTRVGKEHMPAIFIVQCNKNNAAMQKWGVRRRRGGAGSQLSLIFQLNRRIGRCFWKNADFCSAKK
jgi:hypothetical protein